MKTKRLTVAQAMITFLNNQYVTRDGIERKFFEGCFGIFGHGNVGGIGQALCQMPEFRYYPSRNEQAMVHAAAAFAKMNNRLSTFACTSSIGPGATNMITAAAGATINRLPVLLLPGDFFASRKVDPVLQQLESPLSQDISVNDCFKPISKYWDRISRPEQIISSLPAAMRVLTSPSETGAVTISLPQDVQTEAYDFPLTLFQKKVIHIERPLPEKNRMQLAVAMISTSKSPIIIAGGGVIYSEATAALMKFVTQTGIPVAETFAGKGAMPYNHLCNLGAAGATGTEGANAMSRKADLVIGIGTRYSDFTTASKTAFQNPDVKFININISDFDAYKQGALMLVGDAKATLQELTSALKGFEVSRSYRNKAASYNKSWDIKVTKAYKPSGKGLPSQAEIIGAVNEFSKPDDVVVCAAGSLPGDLHKLWRTRSPKGFHLEYGYSCMGYEIAGGMGVKMASPDREVYVMVGDGSYLMMSSEIVTSIQEGIKLTIILINNHGFASIGGLSKSLGLDGFGTRYVSRNKKSGQLDGAILPVDLAVSAAGLGAEVIKAGSIAQLKKALAKARTLQKTTVIYIESGPVRKMAGYGHAWWEVPVAEVATSKGVQKASEGMRANRKNQKYWI